MGVKLGLDAKLYRNTGTQAAPVWNEIKNVKDVTLNLEAGEADVTTRGNAGWRATVATLKDGSIEFDMVWDTADDDFSATPNFVVKTLADAARIDGAGPLQFLWNIIVPISRTNLMALFLIEFIYMWNQYLWPLIVANTETTRVIQVGLKVLIATDAAVEWNIVMAGVVVAMVPPLIVLLLTQKSLITGLSLFEEK